jgi:hypothetical protein
MQISLASQPSVSSKGNQGLSNALPVSVSSQVAVEESNTQSLKTAFPSVTLISQPDTTAFTANSPDVYSLASLGKSQVVNANSDVATQSLTPVTTPSTESVPSQVVSSDISASSAFAADYSIQSSLIAGQSSKKPQTAEDRLKEIEGKSATQTNASTIQAVSPSQTSQGIDNKSGQSSPSSVSVNVSSNVKASSVPKSPYTGFTKVQLKQIAALAARDRQVRTHEQQHQAAGGSLAGSASFSFITGPDGVQYAVGGEVPINLSSVPGNPAQTIARMEVVRSAALAPADPSAADRAVAAAATRIILQAQSNLLAKNNAERLAQIKTTSEGTISASTSAKGDNTASTSGNSKSLPGANLPDQAGKIGSSIYRGVKAYEYFIKSHNQSPLYLSQIV